MTDFRRVFEILERTKKYLPPNIDYSPDQLSTIKVIRKIKEFENSEYPEVRDSIENLRTLLFERIRVLEDFIDRQEKHKEKMETAIQNGDLHTATRAILKSIPCAAGNICLQNAKRICSRCKDPNIRYCGKEHQSEHWSIHRHECNKTKSLEKCLPCV